MIVIRTADVFRDVATSYNNLGAIYYDKQDTKQLIEVLQKALNTWKQTLGESHPNVGGMVSKHAGINDNTDLISNFK